MRLIENSCTQNIFNSLRESESIPSMRDENFNETVLRDFRLFLMDKYGDELYKDVTDEDVNEYFTGMFYDIWDNDDLDSANAAEDIIRAEYHLSDKSDFNESVEEHDLSKDLFGDAAANRMSQKEKKLKRDLQYVRDIMAGKKVIDDKYHEEISLNTAKYWLRDDFIYVNELSSYDSDEVNKRLADAYPDIFSVNESARLNEGGIYPVEIEEDASQALVNKIAEILGCDSSEDISVDGLELIPAKGFAGGGQYWFRAQINIGQAGAYHEDFIWKALEAVKDQCPHLYKIYENGTQSGPGSIITGETNGLEVNYYSTIDIVDDEEVENGLSFEYSNEDLEIAGCDLKTLEAEETPVGDYLCSLVKEHMSELIELLKSYEISEDDSKYELKETARYATNIDWETDGDDEVKKELPKKVEIPQDVTEDTVADWLSDKYGWLVNSVSITENANDTVDKKPNCVIFYLNGKELGGHDLKNEFEGERESAKELFAYENKVKPEDIEERLEYRESMNESVKSKKSTKKQPKENKRVIMQQGNVTCFKENDNTYYVFENENDNEVEHDSEESAMHDFLERVGIDANAELKEK